MILLVWHNIECATIIDWCCLTILIVGGDPIHLDGLIAQSGVRHIIRFAASYITHLSPINQSINQPWTSWPISLHRRAQRHHYQRRHRPIRSRSQATHPSQWRCSPIYDTEPSRCAPCSRASSKQTMRRHPLRHICLRALDGPSIFARLGPRYRTSRC